MYVFSVLKVYHGSCLDDVMLVSELNDCVCDEESVCLCLVISSEGGHSIRSSLVVYL